jgi:hypothetical protein
MSERVNHPTAYSPVFEFMSGVLLLLASLLARGGQPVDYKTPFSFHRLVIWRLGHQRECKMFPRSFISRVQLQIQQDEYAEPHAQEQTEQWKRQQPKVAGQGY